MRILHILNSNKFSGAENVVITIIKNMPNNYNCIYMCVRGPIEEKLLENGITYFLVNKLSKTNIRKAIKEFSPDIIHAHDFRASVLASMVKTDAILVSHIHNNVPFMKTWNLKSLLYFRSVKKYKKVLGVSPSVLDECIFKNKLAKKFKLVSNPIDFEFLNKQYTNGQKKFDICFVGRLTEQKNPLRFVSIVQKIKKIDNDVKAVIVGGGELEQEVCGKIISENLSDNISVVGYKKNPFEYLNKSRMLFLTSEWEGFGLVLVEAMAMRLPVAATKVGGTSQIVQGCSGVLCESDNDYVDFYLKLCDRETYESYSNGALNQAKEMGNIEQYISNLINEVYEVV